MSYEDPKDAAVVDAWLRRLAQSPLHDSSRLNRDVIWWRARLERRRDAERRARRRVERGENVAIVLFGAAVSVGAAFVWVAAPAGQPFLAAAGMAVGVALAIAAHGAKSRSASRR